MSIKRLYRIFKVLVITLLISYFVVYIGLFVLLRIPSIQNKIRKITVSELSLLLDTKVSVNRVAIEPLNRVKIYGLQIYDQQGDTLLYADRVMAGVRPYALLENDLVFSNIHPSRNLTFSL